MKSLKQKISNPVLRDFYQRNFFPLKVFKIKSRTNFNPDLGEFQEYRVELWKDNIWYCDCIGFTAHKKECRHIKIAKELLNK